MRTSSFVVLAFASASLALGGCAAEEVEPTSQQQEITGVEVTEPTRDLRKESALSSTLADQQNAELRQDARVVAHLPIGKPTIEDQGPQFGAAK